MNSITLKPEINELYTLNDFILNELGEENLHVNLIIEEVFVNIVDYSKTDFIIVNAEFKKPTLTVEFIDNGIEFNPLLKKILPYQMILMKLKSEDWEFFNKGTG